MTYKRHYGPYSVHHHITHLTDMVRIGRLGSARTRDCSQAYWLDLLRVKKLSAERAAALIWNDEL